ncbi:MAG: adenylate/guanylate cyclase domain-containing protein, partial [Phycisphaerae bacterium]
AATGNAIVGPCGSEQKYDYTCIGDSVNVASRLESANKFYGTQILVSSATREQVGDAFEFRPLGGVRVKGKEHAVPIYELLGRAGQVADDVLAYARAFGGAVALFQQRQWRAALDAFKACLKRRPEDTAAENYIEATALYLGDPPDDGWTGAIELKEK